MIISLETFKSQSLERSRWPSVLSIDFNYDMDLSSLYNLVHLGTSSNVLFNKVFVDKLNKVYPLFWVTRIANGHCNHVLPHSNITWSNMTCVLNPLYVVLSWTIVHSRGMAGTWLLLTLLFLVVLSFMDVISCLVLFCVLFKIVAQSMERLCWPGVQSKRRSLKISLSHVYMGK